MAKMCSKLVVFLLVVLFSVGQVYAQNQFTGTWKITQTIGLLTDGMGEKEKVHKQYTGKMVKIGADYITVGASGDYLKSFTGFTISFKKYVSYKKAPGIYPGKFFDSVYGDNVFGVDEYETTYKIDNSEPPYMMLYKINDHRIVLYVNDFLFFLERK